MRHREQIELIKSVVSTRKENNCRQCNRPTQAHGRGRELKLRHLPVFGKQTILLLLKRKNQKIYKKH